jgi:hypothetical protein
MKLIQQIDIITFLAESQGKVFVVWEWENEFALAIHLQERVLLDKSKNRDRLAQEGTSNGKAHRSAT